MIILVPFALMLVVLLAGCPATAPAKPPVGPSRPVPLDGRFDGVLPDVEDDALFKVHLIDVGQGAATLVEFSCAAVLIDTGGEKNAGFDSTARLLAYLEAFFTGRPDLNRTLALLVITHPHIDHTRGIKSVLGAFAVQNVVTNGAERGSGGPQQAWLQKLALSQPIPLRTVRLDEVPAGGLSDEIIDPVACVDGDPDLRVLWGAVDPEQVSWGADAADNANNHSVVVRVALGKAALLVTGDMEEEAIPDLIALHEGTGALDVDVYQVGHHGSANGTTEALLDSISPAAALIAAGSTDRRFLFTAWAHGHPGQGVLELLEGAVSGTRPTSVDVDAGVGGKKFETFQVTKAIYATAWDGDIVVQLSGAGGTSVISTRTGAP